MKNGHRFHFSNPRLPEEKHLPGTAGDYGCVLCGTWTTYCLSAEKADEKMGPCPQRVDGGPKGGPPQTMEALGFVWDLEPNTTPPMYRARL